MVTSLGYRERILRPCACIVSSILSVQQAVLAIIFEVINHTKQSNSLLSCTYKAAIVRGNE